MGSLFYFHLYLDRYIDLDARSDLPVDIDFRAAIPECDRDSERVSRTFGCPL